MLAPEEHISINQRRILITHKLLDLFSGCRRGHANTMTDLELKSGPHIEIINSKQSGRIRWIFYVSVRFNL